MISLIYFSFYYDNLSFYIGRVLWNVLWFFKKIYYRLILKYVYYNRLSCFIVSFFNNYFVYDLWREKNF